MEVQVGQKRSRGKLTARLFTSYATHITQDEMFEILRLGRKVTFVKLDECEQYVYDIFIMRAKREIHRENIRVNKVGTQEFITREVQRDEGGYLDRGLRPLANQAQI